MLSTHRRTARLAAVLGTTAAVAASLAVASDLQGSAASTPSAYDYCVSVPDIWVHDIEVYPGGLYCVPVPLSSQRM